MTELNYVPLHQHTGIGSPLDGYGEPAQLVSRLLELGQAACACTDHGSVIAHRPFAHEMLTAGLKPIFGLEAYLCEDVTVRGVKSEGNQQEQRRSRSSLNHITLLAMTQKGYRNLLKISSDAYRIGYYYKSRTDYKAIIQHQEGIAVLTGCVAGHLSRLINTDKEDLAFKWLSYLKQNIQNLYVELIPCPGLDISHRACQTLFKMAQELKLLTIATDDSHFPRKEDWPAEDTMVARAVGEIVGSPDRKLQIPEIHYRCSAEEVLDRLKLVMPQVPEVDLRQAMANSVKLAGQCNVELKKASGPVFNVQAAFTKMVKPPEPAKQTAEELLHLWVAEGRQARQARGEMPRITDPAWKIYEEREAYELDIIRHHNFVSYFLVVTDLVRWAHAEKILTVARGSCGGSLLCWYLQITQVDPVKYDLPVERFLGYFRPSLPDIDIDTSKVHRDRFFHFLIKTYGEENCALIAALSHYRARQAVRDVGAAHALPDEAIAAMLDLVPEAAQADEGLKATGTLKRLFAESASAQSLIAQHPAFIIAADLEGQVRQSSIHAAGFVVDAKPIQEAVGIQGKPADLPIASCDKDECERAGLLKIDVLSVAMLSVLAEVAEELGHEPSWIFDLPLDDPATYQMLAEGRNTGVFQLQGNAAGRLMRDLQPTQFSDIDALSALARPGPLQSGGAAHFISRRRGREVRTTLHPLLEAILAPTEGVILYQESVMRVMREVGGFDWIDVDKVRKLIAKSGGGEAMDAYLDPYLAGARERSVPEQEAMLIWDLCRKAGNYLFPHAHGLAYAKVAMFSAYLKRHYPARFTAAFARHEEKDELRQSAFNDFKDLGGRFILIDPNKSQIHFTTIDDHTILGGFQNLESCGPKSAEKLVAGQPYEDWSAFYRTCPKTLRDRLWATGIHEGRVDQDAVLHVAPWFVEIAYSDLERAAAERMGATTVAATHHADRGEIRLVGRVTQVETINVVAEAKKYNQRPPGPGEPTLRAVVTLADETGSTLLHISPRRFEQLVAQRNPLRGPYSGIGNSIYVATSWNRPHTKLYCEDMICFREAPLFVPATPDELDPVLTKKVATRKRRKKDE